MSFGDLNACRLRCAAGLEELLPAEVFEQLDEGGFMNTDVRVITNGILAEIKPLFARWPACVAAMAWFTERDLISLMQGKSLGIVMQKEHHLRDNAEACARLLETPMYRQHGVLPTGEEIWPVYRDCAVGMQRSPLRCVGEPLVVGWMQKERDESRKWAESRPNMHHKFVVFGDFETAEEHDAFADAAMEEYSWAYPRSTETVYRAFRPRAVLWGSFNFSANASRSMESVLYSGDAAAARAFYRVWGKTYMLGERWLSVEKVSRVMEPELMVGG